MSHIKETELKRFILDSDLVAEKDVSAAEEQAVTKNQSIGEVLVSRGLLSEDDLRRIQANILGIPFVSLKKKKIDFDILSLIPEPIARNHNIVAFAKTGEGLEVAMLDVDDLAATDFVKKKVKLKILPRLTDTESMKSSLLQYQRSLKAEFGDIIERETSALKQIPEKEGEEVDEDELKKMAEDLPVVRIVDTLLKHAILQNASDVHIEPLETELLIRYRIDGILHDAMVLPKHAASSVVARIKVLAKLKLDEKRLPQDGRFKVEVEGQKVSLRVSILPTFFGEKTVMRLLKESDASYSLEGLGFHGASLERIHAATKQTTGLILATGPTGSGKTTTLYTVLDMVNTPEVNISTVEDPIEYQVARINQTQVKPDIGFSFSEGLRSLVRQDPDIIMVGEIRDSETASLAINAALTGHLVLSTLHTNSAAGAVPRLVDMGCEPFLLTSTLRVVIGQRLVRRLCAKKEKYRLSSAEIESLGKKVNMDKVLATLIEEKIAGPNTTWADIDFYRPVASDECADGYSGRIGLHEALTVTTTIKELIMKGATTEEVQNQAEKEGMLTMLEDGIFLAAQGLTTIEEVLRVISE
jgi:type IV pilus assembly protein PilB